MITTVEKETQHTVREHFTFHVYQSVVHVIKTTYVTKRKPTVEEWLISREQFEQNKDRRSLNWASGGDSFEIVTPAYLEHYKSGFRTEFPIFAGRQERYEDPNDWERLLSNGVDDRRIIRDYSSNNGFFYDVEGNIVSRAFFYDYIHSLISSHTHHVLKVLKHLQQQDGIVEVGLVEIPYYNEGGRGIEFAYQPSEQYFRRLIKEHEKEQFFGAHSWGIRDRIFKRLKLNQKRFQKPQASDEDDDDDAF